MINPNICKRVLVRVLNENDPKPGLWAVYKDEILPIIRGYKKPGMRYCYLKFSIFNDSYYLTGVE